MLRSHPLLPAMLAALLVSGCALLTKSDPLVPRYFSPELAEPPSPPKVPSAAGDLAVRLGRIGGGSFLKERIVYRTSEHEFGFYEDRRWTERPEVYLQRALEASLFEHGRMRRSLSATAPTLTVDLVEFEEVRGTAPHVRVRVAYALHDEQTVFFEHTLVIDRASLPGTLGASRPEEVAVSLGEALREAVARVTTDVTASLLSRVSRPVEGTSER